MRLAAPLLTGAAVVVLLFAGCLPGSGPPLVFYQDDAGSGPPVTLGSDSGSLRADVDLGDPFAATGLSPSHGPWNGGTSATLNGRGFPSTLRVFIGGTELASSAILASSPIEAEVITPGGKPGPADVTILDPGTQATRTLRAGFYYDSFYAQPNTGATSGGTRITLLGAETAWTAGTKVTIASQACTAVTVVDPTHIQCTTPPGAPGTVDVAITMPDGSFAQAFDAYTYADSVDGYRGGLSGGALNGSLRVLLLDDYTGNVIPGGTVIAGDSLATALTGKTDASGVVNLIDPSLVGAVTVTVAATCHQPTTFVAVPVDTVTAYIDPILDPSCLDGDPPSLGSGTPADASAITGQLVFPGQIEFMRGGWVNVPAPVRPTERVAAYVFNAAGDPFQTFALPPVSSATTPQSSGTIGYAYTLPTTAGNVTLYALAGIEDRSVSPPLFTAYAMGVARGVLVTPGSMVQGVNIAMNTLLDHQVTTVPMPPSPSAMGPDRYEGLLAVTLGAGAFATLPSGRVTAPLPISGDVVLSGVPALDGSLAGEQYILTGVAGTGAAFGIPSSSVARIATSDSNDPIAVGGFLGIPEPISPGTQVWDGTTVNVGNATGPIDLTILDVASGHGRTVWRVVAPGGITQFQLPDLGSLPGDLGPLHGAITTTVHVVTINGAFSYGNLRYGDLGSSTWNAIGVNTAVGTY